MWLPFFSLWLLLFVINFSDAVREPLAAVGDASDLAALMLRKQAPALGYPGQPLMHIYTFSNVGTVTAFNISAQDRFGAGAIAEAGGDIRVASLAPGAEAVVKVTVSHRNLGVHNTRARYAYSYLPPEPTPEVDVREPIAAPAAQREPLIRKGQSSASKVEIVTLAAYVKATNTSQEVWALFCTLYIIPIFLPLLVWIKLRFRNRVLAKSFKKR